MPGFLAKRVTKRLGRGLPIVQIWTAANLAMLTGRHLSHLSGRERGRVAQLLHQAHGRPSTLNHQDAAELRSLTDKLELRLLAGTAMSRLSPVGLPKRALYGRKGSPARQADAARRRQATAPQT